LVVVVAAAVVLVVAVVVVVLMVVVVIVVIRGRVSKYVTNGGKTAAMDVIGFLCASLGSSTVNLHDSLRGRRACACSEAGISSQNGDRA
jgi:flagellar basal body-associated protein FliL